MVTKAVALFFLDTPNIYFGDKFIMKSINFSFLLLPLLFLVTPVLANSTFAVTDFELLNLTLKLSDPKKVAAIDAEDQERIRMMDKLIREGIANTDGFTMTHISEADRSKADESVGYLFDCAKCSADLGRTYDADYILIGRLHKPTYLFSYIIVRIFDVKANRLIKEYRTEAKGKPSKSVPGAIDNMLIKIRNDIPH